MPVLHQVKIRKVTTQTVGVTFDAPDQERAVRDVLLRYERDGYDVESVDKQPVLRCESCTGLIFNGEGIRDMDGKVYCPQCLSRVVDVVMPEPCDAVA